MDTQSFYTTVGTTSFFLMGLWWIVVQGRPEWRKQPWRRMLAYVVSLHFLLPGVMSILSLAAPQVPWLWQASFAVAGGLGALGVVLVQRALREEADCPGIVRLSEWVVLPIYVVVTAVALMPDTVRGLGLGLTPIQVEAVILSILLFFGAQSAWVMLIEIGFESSAAAVPAERPVVVTEVVREVGVREGAPRAAAAVAASVDQRRAPGSSPVATG